MSSLNAGAVSQSYGALVKTCRESILRWQQGQVLSTLQGNTYQLTSCSDHHFPSPVWLALSSLNNNIERPDIIGEAIVTEFAKGFFKSV